MACTISAAAATFAAASRCGTVCGRSVLEWCVDDACEAVNSTARTSGCTSSRTADGIPPGWIQASVKPPSRAGATLSGWPSISVANCSNRSCVSSWPPPGSNPRPNSRPPTIAAAEDPCPPPCGMALRQRNQTGGKSRSIARQARAIARTTRWVSSLGTSPAPTPSTSTRRPSVRNVALASSYRCSARPKQSYPGPRFADVAGTRTVARRPSTAADVRSRVAPAVSLTRDRGPWSRPPPRLR